MNVSQTSWQIKCLMNCCKNIFLTNTLCQSGNALLNWRQHFHLQLSKLNFGGMGARMMKDLADEHKVASVQELLELAQQMGVKLWPCQMTMDLMGLTDEDLIPGLGAPAGAGSAISMMKDAEISLFI